MMCATPVAALDRGAVRELVDEGRTGHTYASLDALARGLGDVLALDRRQVRARALERFRPERMVDAHIDLYRRIVAAHRARPGTNAAGRPRSPAAPSPAGPRPAGPGLAGPGLAGPGPAAPGPAAPGPAAPGPAGPAGHQGGQQ